RHCEGEAVDSCHTSPCHNGATCAVATNTPLGYSCHCAPGFEGPSCADPAGRCDGLRCRNGGRCSRLAPSAPPRCSCPPGYSGVACQFAERQPPERQPPCSSPPPRWRLPQRRSVPPSPAGSVLSLRVPPALRGCADVGCAGRAGDGRCDAECNSGECEWDGGDCSLRYRNPWRRCPAAAACWSRFGDGRCDEQCAGAGPLYAQYCEDHASNGECDEGCNSGPCGWDGGDCAASRPLGGTLVVVVRLPPDEFLAVSGRFVQQLGEVLLLAVRVRRDRDGRLMVLPFYGTGNAGNAAGTRRARSPGHRPKYQSPWQCRQQQRQQQGQQQERQQQEQQQQQQGQQGQQQQQQGQQQEQQQQRQQQQQGQQGQQRQQGQQGQRRRRHSRQEEEQEEAKPLGSEVHLELFEQRCLNACLPSADAAAAFLAAQEVSLVHMAYPLIAVYSDGSEGDTDDSPKLLYAAVGLGLSLALALVAAGVLLRGKRRRRGGKEHGALWLPDGFLLGSQKKMRREPLGQDAMGLRAPWTAAQWTQQHLTAADIHPAVTLTPPQQHGADSDNECVDVDVKGPDALTPLMLASMRSGSSFESGVELEVDEVDEVDDEEEEPRTDESEDSSSANIISDLILQGASLKAQTDRTGETALHLAARYTRADAAKRLLEAGADANAADFTGRTPLHAAVSADAQGVLHILIRNRATDVDARMNDGTTPLILAARLAVEGLAEELVACRADVNAVDDHGERPGP
ncbi:unnamed protein product, partial [Lampetra fluviatilis]